MIIRIKIENFKSIFDMTLETGALNLFTGVNASGKSTFLQSLLLLRQSFMFGGLYQRPTNLLLNNPDGLINLGTFKDVLCQHAKKGLEYIAFEVVSDDSMLKFQSVDYNVENKNSNFLPGIINITNGQLNDEKLFSKGFHYLAADRIDPSEDFPRFQGIEHLGKHGEYAIHFLEKYANTDIPIKNLSLKKTTKTYALINIVNDWLGEISESIEVCTTENLNTNRIELSYVYKLADGTPSQNHKPQNVGFGITHTLPIIIAILSSKEGDILVIENPETHLHPRGQSRLAQLFAIAAENGIQLFIESHSDHIINGLRVAVKTQKISNQKVYFNYFSKTKENLTQIQRLKIDTEGGVDSWPNGFFDEWDNLLNQLL